MMLLRRIFASAAQVIEFCAQDVRLPTSQQLAVPWSPWHRSGAGIVQAMASNARITEDGELEVGSLGSLGPGARGTVGTSAILVREYQRCTHCFCKMIRCDSNDAVGWVVGWLFTDAFIQRPAPFSSTGRRGVTTPKQLSDQRKSGWSAILAGQIIPVLLLLQLGSLWHIRNFYVMARMLCRDFACK